MINPFDTRLATPMTAKRAILAALAATGHPLTTTQLAQCGELFGVDGAAVRMALGRLVKTQDVITIERGVHCLGDKGEPILQALRRWIDLPKHTRPWKGNWVVVHTAHLGRVHRATLRRRERALSFSGFEALYNGLWLRPDNLAIDGHELHNRLIGLGLEEEAFFATDANLVSADTDQIKALWNRDDIESGYRSATRAMTNELSGQKERTIDELARNTAVVGAAVISMLSFDPLLPEELIDASLRAEVHKNMVALDRVGKRALKAFWENNL